MSSGLDIRRRAIYTGLKPFMSEPQLLEALVHWESHYSTAPRFTLQRFVSELCREGPLRSRRADMLLSLVEAMSMPVQSLLPDPLQQRTGVSGSVSIAEKAAFEALMNALIDVTSKDTHYSLQLDLLASLDTIKMPVEFCQTLTRWLADRAAPLSVAGVDSRLLRAIVSRCYVILCEREGPVIADRVLASAVSGVSLSHPALNQAIKKLL